MLCASPADCASTRDVRGNAGRARDGRQGPSGYLMSEHSVRLHEAVLAGEGSAARDVRPASRHNANRTSQHIRTGSGAFLSTEGWSVGNHTPILSEPGTRVVCCPFAAAVATCNMASSITTNHSFTTGCFVPPIRRCYESRVIALLTCSKCRCLRYFRLAADPNI